MTAVSAPQISSWPAASMITHTSATLAPPILSGRWPKNRRAPMKATPNAVKASEALPQSLAANSRAMKAVMTPKPTLDRARPMPGAQTALSTL